MELSTAPGLSNFPSLQPKLLASNRIHSFSCKPQFPFALRFNSVAKTGLGYRVNSSLGPTTSQETSADRNPYDSDDSQADAEVIVETTNLGEKTENGDTQPGEAPEQGSFIENLQLSNFFEEFAIKLDYEDTYSVLVLGGGVAVALWLAAAVVGAIDSIPLFPKVLELVGLGYTIWFTSRFLLFKENRDELVARIEQIKQEVLGSKDN